MVEIPLLTGRIALGNGQNHRNEETQQPFSPKKNTYSCNRLMTFICKKNKILMDQVNEMNFEHIFMESVNDMHFEQILME